MVELTQNFDPWCIYGGFINSQNFVKKWRFLKKNPLHIPYIYPLQNPPKMDKNAKKMAKNGPIEPKFWHMMHLGCFYQFSKFRQKRAKNGVFLPKKTPKIWKNAKIPYKWQPSGTIEANIAYTFEFIAPDPQTKFWENPPIFLLFRAILRKSKKTQKSPTSGNQVAVGHKI